MTTYLEETSMLNYSDAAIQNIIDAHDWRELPEFEKVKAIYDFVRNDIKFGYNHGGDTPQASAVLAEGLGQCNTKSTLLMALLRAVEVPCRLRGSIIGNRLQKEAVGRLAYIFAPKNIIHTWVEVLFENRWVSMEGVIIDASMLKSVQQSFSDVKGTFIGYAIATPCLSAPKVEWVGDDTFIQNEGIVEDYGVFENPDEFYATYGENLNGFRRWLYRNYVQPVMNRNVARIREGSI